MSSFEHLCLEVQILSSRIRVQASSDNVTRIDRVFRKTPPPLCDTYCQEYDQLRAILCSECKSSNRIVHEKEGSYFWMRQFCCRKPHDRE
ncbi:hypothetical protein PZA11_002399 [Diplocarpon coronariae]